MLSIVIGWGSLLSSDCGGINTLVQKSREEISWLLGTPSRLLFLNFDVESMGKVRSYTNSTTEFVGLTSGQCRDSGNRCDSAL